MESGLSRAMDEIILLASQRQPIQFFAANSVLVNERVPLPPAQLNQGGPTITQFEAKDLNLSVDYCKNNSAWNAESSLRELIQNWRDQIILVLGGDDTVLSIETKSGLTEDRRKTRCFIARHRQTGQCAGFITEEQILAPIGTYSISLVNYATRLGDEVLVLGASSKTGNARMAGAHGEGMKVGINRMLSMGMKVGVLTKSEEWVFGHQTKTLWLAKQPLRPHLAGVVGAHMEVTAIMVSGFPNEINCDKYLFLVTPQQLQERAEQSFIDENTKYRVQFLFEPRFLGKVFVKGIYVCETKGLQINATGGTGVDIRQGMSLTRDRDVVSDSQVVDVLAACFDYYGEQAQSKRLNAASMGGMFGRLLELTYQALESNGLGEFGNVFLQLGRQVSGPKALAYLIFYYFLWKHSGGRDPLTLGLTPDFLTEKKIPLILPVMRGVGKEDLEDFEYFLGLSSERIVRCSENLLSVLENFQRPRSIDDYIKMFWQDVLKLGDYNLEGGSPKLFKWIQNQLSECFVGIINLDQFLFKVFPEVPNAVSTMRRKSVRAVRGINLNKNGTNYNLAAIVDCNSLFQACNCPRSGTGNSRCERSCIRNEFFIALKESLFRVVPGARGQFEAQLQANYLRLTGSDKDGGDSVPAGHKNLPSRPLPTVPASSKPAVDNAIPVPAASPGTVPLVSPSGLVTPVTRRTVVRKARAGASPGVGPLDVTPYFPSGSPAPPDPLIKSTTPSGPAEANVYVEECHPIDLEYVHDMEDFHIYVGKDMLEKPGSTSDAVLASHFDHVFLLAETLKTIFKCAKGSSSLSFLGHYNIFISASTQVIAFNRVGKNQVFYNALKSPVDSNGAVDKSRLLSSWLVTMCHEVAHNQHGGHGKEHESAMEQLLSHFIPMVFGSKNEPVSIEGLLDRFQRFGH